MEVLYAVSSEASKYSVTDISGFLTNFMNCSMLSIREASSSCLLSQFIRLVYPASPARSSPRLSKILPQMSPSSALSSILRATNLPNDSFLTLVTAVYAFNSALYRIRFLRRESGRGFHNRTHFYYHYILLDSPPSRHSYLITEGVSLLSETPTQNHFFLAKSSSFKIGVSFCYH